MKTALKLNKKQLLELYEKSNQKIKEGLRSEFGEGFFVQESKSVERASIKKEAPKTKTSQSINWEAILDFTPAFRIAGYALLLGLIFLR